MPIHAAKRQTSGDEQIPLLIDDEERNEVDYSKNGNFQGNGMANGDNPKGSTGYGTVKQHQSTAAAGSAVRNRHRHEISEKLRTFDVDDFEKYRRPEQEIKDCKSKIMKAFLEDQNEKLNDWLEVDAGAFLLTNTFKHSELKQITSFQW